MRVLCQVHLWTQPTTRGQNMRGLCLPTGSHEISSSKVEVQTPHCAAAKDGTSPKPPSSLSLKPVLVKPVRHKRKCFLVALPTSRPRGLHSESQEHKTTLYTTSALRKYRAAGVALYSLNLVDDNLYLLMTYIRGDEDRATGLTFVGGKRELTDSSAAATAAREIEEETYGLLKRQRVEDDLSKGVWYHGGQYVLFIHQLDHAWDYPDKFRKLYAAGGELMKDENSIALEWVPLYRLQESLHGSSPLRFHKFTRLVLRGTVLMPLLLSIQRKLREAVKSNKPVNLVGVTDMIGQLPQF